MFDRFTGRALKVLFHAHAKASQFGANAIEPEHILLGILDEGGGLGSRIVTQTGNALDDVRHDVVARLARGEPVPVSNEIPFGVSGKLALESAAEEADLRSHKHIGTEHLLLGLLSEKSSTTAEILTARGSGGIPIRRAASALASCCFRSFSAARSTHRYSRSNPSACTSAPRMSSNQCTRNANGTECTAKDEARSMSSRMSRIACPARAPNS
jgi:ATP-dependent Clp protease ATP-binding subunit ClpA